MLIRQIFIDLNVEDIRSFRSNRFFQQILKTMANLLRDVITCKVVKQLNRQQLQEDSRILSSRQEHSIQQSIKGLISLLLRAEDICKWKPQVYQGNTKQGLKVFRGQQRLKIPHRYNFIFTLLKQEDNHPYLSQYTQQGNRKLPLPQNLKRLNMILHTIICKVYRLASFNIMLAILILTRIKIERTAIRKITELMFIITSILISLMFAEGGSRIFIVKRNEMKATKKTAAFRPENEFSSERRLANKLHLESRLVRKRFEWLQWETDKSIR